jgi:hypothetical protein
MFTQIREEAQLNQCDQQVQWRKPEAGGHNVDVSYIKESGRAS